jgi:hypothetical protein
MPKCYLCSKNKRKGEFVAFDEDSPFMKSFICDECLSKIGVE